MLKQLLTLFDRKAGLQTLSAHCDVPCGIYDPFAAQYAALSVLRFMDQIAEIEGKGDLSVADQAKLVRLVNEKEIHAEKAKHEVRVIWGDYFKQPQLEKFPNTHEVVHNIMLAGSASKQGIDRADAEKFLNLINEFAEMFWQSKDVETYTAKAPYKPEADVVYPKLK